MALKAKILLNTFKISTPFPPPVIAYHLLSPMCLGRFSPNSKYMCLKDKRTATEIDKCPDKILYEILYLFVTGHANG